MTSFQKTLQYGIYAGIIAILFTPFVVPFSTLAELFVGPSYQVSQTAYNLFFPYITGKAYFFRIIVEIVFLIWIALAIAKPEYRPKRGVVMLSITAFLIGICISNILGVNPVASFWSNFERMDGFVTLAHVFALFVVAGSCIKSEAQWKGVFVTSLGLSIVMAYLVIKQISSFAIEGQLFRADATLGNPIYLAAYALFHIFLAVMYMTRTRYKSIGWGFYLVVALINVWVLFQTGTRGAIVGLVAGVFVTLFLVIVKHWNNVRVRATAISVFAIGLIGVTILMMYKDSTFVQSSPILRRATNISIVEGTGEARILNWQIALKGFRERPVLGWGQSNYNIVFDKEYLPAMHGNEAWFDRTHNIFLDWMIAGGIIGLLLLISIFASALYVIWRRSEGFSAFDKSIITGLLVAYVVHNLFVFDHVVSYILLFLVFAYVHTHTIETRAICDSNVSPRFISISMIVCILAIPFVTYAINGQSYKANQELVDAMKILARDPVTNELTYFYAKGLSENLALFESAIARNTFANPEIRQHMMLTSDTILRIQDEGSIQFKEQFVSTVISELEKQIAEVPGDSRYPYLLGTYYARLGDAGNAEKWLLQAINLSPRKQAIRVPLIRTYIQSGQKEKALSFAKETYELDTSKDDMWIEYAKVASAVDPSLFTTLINEAATSGDFEKAITLLEYGVERQTDKPQALISLAAFYNTIGDATSSIATIDRAIEAFPSYSYQLNKIRQDVLRGLK